MNYFRFMRFKFLCLVVCIAAILQPNYAQNLIDNYSFEDTIGDYNPFVIKKELASLYNSKSWMEMNTANYFWYGNFDGLSNHKNSETTAYSGECFAGIFIENIKDVRSREFLLNKLNSTVQRGDTLEINLFAKFSQESKSRFSELTVSFTDSNPKITSNCANYSVLKTTEAAKNGWLKFTGEYIAIGNEKFVVIGQIEEKLKLTKNELYNRKVKNNRGFYVFIDDVKIENKNRSNNNIHNNSKLSISEPTYLRSIYYNPNESYLNDTSKTYLDSLASIIVNSPNAMLKIVSYADSSGNENYNKNLSFERAKKVADYLISKGVSSEKLSFNGLGEIIQDKPKSNLSRRTELYFIRK